MKKKLQILDYVYEKETEEDIQTYILTKENETHLLIPQQHFYFSILGEKTIEKLIARGYLSMEEIYQKYNNHHIEKQKTKLKKRH